MCPNTMFQTKSNIKKNTSIRLRSLDFLKGFSIIVIIYIHSLWWLTNPPDLWIFAWQWIILDVFGPSLFVTMTSIGVTISVLKQQNNPKPEEKSPLIRILKRALILYIIGIPFIGNFLVPSPFGFFDPRFMTQQYIFQLIAICQIVTYFILKIRKEFRIIIVICIIIINELVFNYLLTILAPLGVTSTEFPLSALNNFGAWIFLLFFRAQADLSIMPWIIVPILGSIAGENIYSNIISRTRVESTEIPNRSRVNFIIYYGLILITIGIATGLMPISNYKHMGMLIFLNTGNPVNIYSLPAFLFRGTTQNLLYACGIAIFLSGLLIRLIDFQQLEQSQVKNIKKETRLNRTIYNLATVGQFSLTIFIMHHMLILFKFWVYLPIILVFFIDVAYISLNLYIILLLAKKSRGKYTLEYLIRSLIK